MRRRAKPAGRMRRLANRALLLKAKSGRRARVKRGGLVSGLIIGGYLTVIVARSRPRKAAGEVRGAESIAIALANERAGDEITTGPGFESPLDAGDPGLSAVAPHRPRGYRPVRQRVARVRHRVAVAAAYATIVGLCFLSATVGAMVGQSPSGPHAISGPFGSDLTADYSADREQLRVPALKPEIVSAARVDAAAQATADPAASATPPAGGTPRSQAVAPTGTPGIPPTRTPRTPPPTKDAASPSPLPGGAAATPAPSVAANITPSVSSQATAEPTTRPAATPTPSTPAATTPQAATPTPFAPAATTTPAATPTASTPAATMTPAATPTRSTPAATITPAATPTPSTPAATITPAATPTSSAGGGTAGGPRPPVQPPGGSTGGSVPPTPQATAAAGADDEIPIAAPAAVATPGTKGSQPVVPAGPTRLPASQPDAGASQAARVQRVILFGLLALTVFAAMGAGVVAVTAAFGSRTKVVDPRVQSRITELVGWRADQVVGAGVGMCPNCGRLIGAGDDGDGEEARCTACDGIQPGDLGEFPELEGLAESDEAEEESDDARGEIEVEISAA